MVHPGGVATNIARNSRTGVGMTDNARRDESIERFETVAQTTPDAAALRIIKGIEKNQPRILIGNDARVTDFLQRLRPRPTGRRWRARSSGWRRRESSEASLGGTFRRRQHDRGDRCGQQASERQYLRPMQ